MTHHTDDVAEGLTADDRARLAAITADADDATLARRVLGYYRDLDRAERTPRGLLYLHLGLLAGRLTRRAPIGVGVPVDAAPTENDLALFEHRLAVLAEFPQAAAATIADLERRLAELRAVITDLRKDEPA
jgi:hypothetical protein